MGGLGVFAWIAIGVIGGWTVSRLMVGPEDDALRGTAAGMIGAVLAALGVRLLDPAPALGNTTLNTLVAALGGSLWLARLTCVATSGRRRDAERPAEVPFTRPEDSGRVEPQRSALPYAAARDQLVEQLLRDAVAHEAEQYDDIGRRFDTVERSVPRVVTRFDAASQRSPVDRVQVVTEWLRER